MDAAIGLEKRANVSTRGWFRIDPGQCRQVLDGALDADLVYVHARTPPVYGSAPMPQTRPGRTVHSRQRFRPSPMRAAARSASRRASPPRGRPNSPKGPTVNLAEEADYDDAQARLAGIQRLLTIAGYDAYPIDGVDGAKTQAALTKFLADRKLPADAAAKPDVFRHPARRRRAIRKAHGFSWCNDTQYAVMAALGIVEMGQIVTRGWYRVAAGNACGRTCAAIRTGSTAMARLSTATGAPSSAAIRRSSWGGNVALCTRDGKFELCRPQRLRARAG